MAKAIILQEYPDLSLKKKVKVRSIFPQHASAILHAQFQITVREVGLFIFYFFSSSFVLYGKAYYVVLLNFFFSFFLPFSFSLASIIFSPVFIGYIYHVTTAGSLGVSLSMTINQINNESINQMVFNQREKMTRTLEQMGTFFKTINSICGSGPNSSLSMRYCVESLNPFLG